MQRNITKKRIWLMLLVTAVLCYAIIPFPIAEGLPQYPVSDAEKIDRFVDPRDGSSYDVLVMRRKISHPHDSIKIVEFRLFIQSIRFKTAHSKDTLGTTFYTRSEAQYVCPSGWQVASSLASGSVQLIKDSLFVGSLAASSLLDEEKGPLIKYSDNGFFIIDNSDTLFVPGFNRIWVADSGKFHPSAYVDEVKLLNDCYLEDFLNYISQYPFDNTKEYMLPVWCMWSSDGLISPVFQSAIPFGHDGFIPVKRW